MLAEAENAAQGEWTLPDGWVWTTLGEIRIDESSSITPKKTPEQDFELYSVPSFADGKPEIVKGEQVGSSKRAVREKAVLLCKINPRINRVWVVGNHSPWPKISSTEWIPFFQVDGIEPDYLCYFMQQDPFRDFLALHASGVGGSLMRVKPTTFADYPFPLAPLPEQHRIVAEIETQFTRLDASVAALERAQANIRRYKASVLQAACEGRLVPTEAELARTESRAYEPADRLLARILAERRPRWTEAETAKLERQGRVADSASSVRGYKEPMPLESNDLPTLPDGWIWTSLDSLIYYTVDYRGKTPPSAPNGVPIISAANVKDGQLVFDNPRYISHETYQEVLVRGVPEPGDLIVTTEAPVGAVALFPDTGTYHLTRRVIGFQTLEVDNRYLMYCFYGDATQKHLKKHSRGTTVPRILKPRLLASPIPLPPLAEQRRIVAEVERRLSLVAALEASVEAALARARRLRQAVLKRAFEGRLVPQDPDDEPASALLARIRAQRENVRKTSRGKRGARQMRLPTV